MSVNTVDAIERSVHKTNEWLSDLDRELDSDDRAMAWRVLKAYLQVLRDRLLVNEAAQLAAQFTHLIRGAYYEGYNPDRTPETIRDPDVYLARLAERGQLSDVEEARRVAVAGTNVLRRHVTEGELDDVLSQLPREIRELLEGAI
jgi:uncharacterized protein (DUF2267 family)